MTSVFAASAAIKEIDKLIEKSKLQAALHEKNIEILNHRIEELGGEENGK